MENLVNDTAERVTTARLLTPAELGLCVRLFREMRQWSQEQLAEISGLNVRTIQRVEQGLAASLDTRRALAGAFEFEDLDVLNKPFAIPTEEELKAQKAKFDREHVTLTALPLTTGKQLAKLTEAHMMDLSEPGCELEREADEASECVATMIGGMSHGIRDDGREGVDAPKLIIGDLHEDRE